MFLYLLNNIVLFFLLFFFKKKNFYLLVLSILSIALIIYFLPGTATDYSGYKRDYESGRMVDSFPYFNTLSIIDSEPYYKNYTAFIKVVTGLSFNGYLALNFILGYSLMYFGLKSIFKPNAVTIFMMLGLISIVPAIFYFLLRSSIPYILAVLVLVLYAKKRPYLAMAVSFLAMGFHSQYIPALFMLGASYLWYELFIKGKQSTARIFAYTVVMSLLLLMVLKWAVPILSMLSFLPTDTEFLLGKSRALTGGTEGFRLTSFLSIIVFPLMYFYLVKKEKFLEVFQKGESRETYNRFIFLLGSAVLLAFVINLAFINVPLVAGRLSRFSDYTFLMIGVGTFFLTIKNSDKLLPLILLIIICVAPFLYPTVYDFNLSIIDIW